MSPPCDRPIGGVRKSRLHSACGAAPSSISVGSFFLSGSNPLRWALSRLCGGDLGSLDEGGRGTADCGAWGCGRCTKNGGGICTKLWEAMNRKKGLAFLALMQYNPHEKKIFKLRYRDAGKIAYNIRMHQGVSVFLRVLPEPAGHFLLPERRKP